MQEQAKAVARWIRNELDFWGPVLGVAVAVAVIYALVAVLSH
jgi:hypothetical protein